MKLQGRRQSKKINDVRGIEFTRGNRQIAAIRSTNARPQVRFEQGLKDLMDHERAKKKVFATRGDRKKSFLKNATSGMEGAAKRDYDKKVKKAR